LSSLVSMRPVGSAILVFLCHLFFWLLWTPKLCIQSTDIIFWIWALYLSLVIHLSFFLSSHSLYGWFLSPVTLGKYHSSTMPNNENDAHYSNQSEDETMEQILQREKSAAGILCRLKMSHGTQISHPSFTNDVLGVVATLGKVDDDNLGRSVWIYLLSVMHVYQVANCTLLTASL